MLRTQLQIRFYQSQVKETKQFSLVSERMGKQDPTRWKMVETTGSLICSKHFEVSDFVYDTNDTNNRRKRKLQEESLNTDR